MDNGLDNKKLDRVITLLETYLDEVERHKVDSEKHLQHHEFLEKFIEEYELRSQFWRTALNRAATAGIVSVFLAIGSAVIFTIKYHLSSNI